jgi:heme-degrading monooxygenase HmoA
MTEYCLAQANIARMLAPPDDPLLADFVAQLDRINALAESSPGFVWRYVSDARKPEDREYDDPMLLFNMSVWESAEHLYDYAYRSDHARVFADRRKWFEKLSQPQVVLWWVPSQHRPTVAEAQQRLNLLAAQGPSPRAFTFRVRYDPDGNAVEAKKPAAV